MNLVANDRAENERHQCREKYRDVIFWKTIISCEREVCYGELANFFQLDHSSWTHRWQTFYLWNTRRAENYGISQFPAVLVVVVVLHRKLSHLSPPSFPPTLQFALRIFAWLLDGEIVFRAWVQSHRRNEILSEFLKGKHFKKRELCSCYQTASKLLPIALMRENDSWWIPLCRNGVKKISRRSRIKGANYQREESVERETIRLSS